MRAGLLGFVAVLFLAACGGATPSHRPQDGQAPTPTVSPPTVTTLPNALTPLSIPSYEGSGQVVHPDIVSFPTPWHGYRYWMAMTPYPGSNDRYENPSIVASNDGAAWVVPSGLTNPLVARPPCDHNSDPDLVYDADVDQLYLFYTVQQRAERCTSTNENQLRLLRSADGVHWSAPQTVIHWNLATTPLYLSPGVIYRRHSFEMWLAGGGGVVHASSVDGLHWSSLDTAGIAAAPWHLDVEYEEARSEYWMTFVDTPQAGSNLRLATSGDGLSWTVYPTPILVPGSGWDNERIYRSTFLLGEDGRLRVWYSAKNRLGQWHIGYAEAANASLAPH